MSADTIQSIVAVAGLVIGVPYVLGAMIINFNLSQYGITEYQIIRAKYFAVGLIFLINQIGILMLAGVLAVLLLLISLPVVAAVLFVISILASMALFWFFSRPLAPPSDIQRTLLTPWILWAALSVIGAVGPFLVLLCGIGGWMAQQLVTYIEYGIAALVLIILLIAQAAYYARRLYSRALMRWVDPIGMGIPIRVRLVGKSKDFAGLHTVGVVLAQDEMTADVWLLDETSEHYIIGIVEKNQLVAIKVKRDLVQAIRYESYLTAQIEIPAERPKNRRGGTEQ